VRSSARIAELLGKETSLTYLEIDGSHTSPPNNNTIMDAFSLHRQ
jgi:hypothetical protein